MVYFLGDNKKKHETFNQGWESLSLDSNSGMLTQGHCRLNKHMSSGFKFRVDTGWYDQIFLGHVTVYLAQMYRRNLLSTTSRGEKSQRYPLYTCLDESHSLRDSGD